MAADLDSADSEAEQHLMDLLADMSDDEIEELAAIAEAIHGEDGGVAP
jgi:hypothetical protein